jgi:hypothetical protein
MAPAVPAPPVQRVPVQRVPVRREQVRPERAQPPPQRQKWVSAEKPVWRPSPEAPVV